MCDIAVAMLLRVSNHTWLLIKEHLPERIFHNTEVRGREVRIDGGVGTSPSQLEKGDLAKIPMLFENKQLLILILVQSTVRSDVDLKSDGKHKIEQTSIEMLSLESLLEGDFGWGWQGWPENLEVFIFLSKLWDPLHSKLLTNQNRSFTYWAFLNYLFRKRI